MIVDLTQGSMLLTDRARRYRGASPVHPLQGVNLGPGGTPEVMRASRASSGAGRRGPSCSAFEHVRGIARDDEPDADRMLVPPYDPHRM